MTIRRPRQTTAKRKFYSTSEFILVNSLVVLLDVQYISSIIIGVIRNQLHRGFMSIINFKEIAKSNPPSTAQDDFELFARDFFELLGYRIIREPDRGPDSGKDMLIQETREGIGGESKVNWLVSCKHFAHTGTSVGNSHETNIHDRVKCAKCDGFIGFYSTIASSTLQDFLERFEDITYQTFDFRKIERNLLSSEDGRALFSRYFPASYNEWTRNSPSKPDLSLGESELHCCYCGRNLIEEKKEDYGIFVIWKELSDSFFTTPIEDMDFTNTDYNETIIAAYHCCKGNCDREMQRKWLSYNHIDSWFELREFTIPSRYIESVRNILYMLSNDTLASEEVFDSIFDFLKVTFHYVARNLTDEEKELIGRIT